MSEEEHHSLTPQAVLTLALVVLAAGYLAWIFYSRWSYARQTARTAAVREVERARREVELNGGSQLKITALYPSPAKIRRGESAQLCYGVVNAKSVVFDPPLDEVWPSMNRCVDVHPTRTTTYTLTARDDAGHSEKSQVKLVVQ